MGESYSRGHSDSVLCLIGRIAIPSPITSASWCKSMSVAVVLDNSFIPLVDGAIPGRKQLPSLINETIPRLKPLRSRHCMSSRW
ncbi:hypothetical protein Y032_0049g1782 [Ancylostoma ceylanicum]|uniref:Uncharacterized protein n=1 Tax=Ancylostoma ceylanicum TaxID=53326 RepID=A0A016UAC5_9BILA|nr:hypothetical protein Y032_0049g1782 [Ancylostoma ceylanicum]